MEQVPELGKSSLAEALPLIVEAVRDHTREDDVAALAVRQAEPDVQARGDSHNRGARAGLRFLSERRRRGDCRAV